MGDWAVTGWAGLELVAPYTNLVPSIQLYLQPELFHRRVPEIFERGKIKKVEEGGNIELWEMSVPLLVSDRAETGLPVINLPRLYSDLLGIGGRATDAAEHLRESQIGY